MILNWAKTLFSRSPSPPPPPLDAPFELVSVHGNIAEATWQELRSRSGTHPVLLGDRETAQVALEYLRMGEESPDAILERGEALDVDAWIKERVAESEDYYSVDESVSRIGRPEPIESFTEARAILTKRPHKEVFFALVPVQHAWQVPCQLKPGGWNECPEPHVHLALFKRWYERYGAIVTTVTNDVIQFTVPNPPTGEAAKSLAWEQYVYCGDIVHQGVGTLGNLAAALQGSKNWYFWWD